MTAIRVALIGMGRMGRAIDTLATEHECTIVSRLDRLRVAREGITRASLGDADVAIEFSVPDAALENATACLRAGVPVVIGTTGWLDQLDTLHETLRATNGRALWAPNFSPGIQLMLALVEVAGRLFRHAPAFDAHLVETHHTAKLDAPSGTAIAVQARTERALGRAVPVTSIRAGSVPGTHELLLDAPFESVTITHTARDRRVFADGALAAARWLAASPRPGLHSMRDVLGLGGTQEHTP